MQGERSWDRSTLTLLLVVIFLALISKWLIGMRDVIIHWQALGGFRVECGLIATG
jgi:hypothetical protein